jgi:NAD(P)H-dependent FMN reductase
LQNIRATLYHLLSWLKVFSNVPREQKSQPVRVLAFSGSPRRGGNTDTLLDSAVAGAASCGAQVKHIILSDLEICPCQHCDGCIQTGGICVVEDDMQQVHHDLRAFDRFILAAPVFFMGIPAHAKAMVDRCQSLWVIKYLMNLPVALQPGAIRRGAFISAGSSVYNNLFLGSVATVKSWYISCDIEYSCELLLPGIKDFDAVKNNSRAMDDAFKLGQDLAG